MEIVLLLKWLHVIGAAVLLGTGAGIAFFMMMANRTKDPALIAQTAGIVVIADYVFTASAVVMQPVTGVLLARQSGWPLTEGWIAASLCLYVLTGLCWLPVVWMQTRMRNLARTAQRQREPLPGEYHVLFRQWFLLGIPAFLAVLGIMWLMIAKPQFRFLMIS